MRVRVIKRYSEYFKRQVVDELENGRFTSITESRLHHGITGGTTIQTWLKKYGRNHLMAKVVRVEKPGEQDQLRAYKKRVSQLEQALGKTQAENRPLFETIKTLLMNAWAGKNPGLLTDVLVDSS